MINMQHEAKKGFVILYAVVVAAIVSLMTAGIFGVAFRESVIANTAVQSMRAFYMADSGLECAFLHEFKRRFAGGGIATTNCDGTGDIFNSTGPFTLQTSGLTENSCSHVFIRRNVNRAGAGNTTEITARGFNVCGAGDEPFSGDPRLVERRLSAWYPCISSASYCN